MASNNGIEVIASNNNLAPSRSTTHSANGSDAHTLGSRPGRHTGSGEIPFNWPSFVGAELANVAEAAERGSMRGDGVFSRRCVELLAAAHGTADVLLTPSCTHAMELAALAMDLRSRDEVILPAFTFPSTANAFVLRGVRPRFVDIRPDTLNIDETKIEDAVGLQTRAIAPVHYNGVASEMETITEIAKLQGLFVLEDNAQGLFGQYHGRPLGTFGDFSALSFHETKNITCGEGGALVINNPAFVDITHVIRDKGTNRRDFARGRVSNYTWTLAGSSYLMSDLLAAVLYAQLTAAEGTQLRRRQLWNRYAKELADWRLSNGIGAQEIPASCYQSAHVYAILMPTPEDRTAFILHMRSRGITAPFHYVPLHLSPMGRQFGGQRGDCPVAERVGEVLVRLPLFNSMTDGEQHRVIQAAREFSCAARPTASRASVRRERSVPAPA